MTYVDAVWNKDKNTIDVVERVAGTRKYKTWPTRFVLGWHSTKGRALSISKTPLDRFETHKWEEFQRELRQIPKEQQYESDVNPIFRCLYDNYKDTPTPKLNVAFFDLEVDFHPDRGFSGIEEAFNPITAVSVYCDWLTTNFTLVLKPRTYTQAQAQEICEKFDNTVLCDTEAELLDVFLTLIEDADVLTGWNSEGYDIPYLVNRLVQVMGREHTRRLCLWNKFPKKREYESYGKPTFTYDLTGRIHLDYLQLYRKHTYQEMHTYRLDFVGEFEVGEKKVAYEGSLDKLYNEDFEQFIAYNRQDVMLLVKIDRKLKFIDLSNDLAHTNGVLIGTTLGSVQLIDNAITNWAHDLGLMVPSRGARESEPDHEILDVDDADLEYNHGIVGAYVAVPVQGMHEWIGGMDINSLYPSTIRSLNMSKETVVGQIRSDSTNKLIQKRMKEEKRSFADAWSDMFHTLEYGQLMNREQVILTVDFEDGSTVDMSGDELYRWIFENPKRQLAVSANGTIFSLEEEGVIPALLSSWYSQRKQMQAQTKDYDSLLTDGIDLTDCDTGMLTQLQAAWEQDQEEPFLNTQSIKSLIQSGKPGQVVCFMKKYNVVLEGKRLILRSQDPDVKSELAYERDFWDRRQLIRKILLNSAYGALANKYSAWFDLRIAQSTTLSGRCIVKHMASKINEVVTGEYDHKGEAIIYGDTDSSVFSSYPVMKKMSEFEDFEWSKEAVVQLYDQIAAITNASFPAFMNKTFHVPENRSVIKAGREYVATKGIFITKKRYAVLIYDKEGKRKDQSGKIGEIKAMGLDLKRSDTPKPVQEFLHEILVMLLTDGTKSQVFDRIKAFRKEFESWPAWTKGTPKRVNKLTYYGDLMRKQEGGMKDMWDTRKEAKKTIPGHVRGSINWNLLKEIHNDHGSMLIQDGFKVIVAKLKENPLGINSVAYPVDQIMLPDWFKSLPFDNEAMAESLITKKVENLLGVLNWDLNQARNNETFDELFSF